MQEPLVLYFWFAAGQELALVKWHAKVHPFGYCL